MKQTYMELPNQFYYKQNRLQQLKGFYHTVQSGSMSKAAQKMGLTQSAVTLQIQSLERDLKIKLFDRDSKKVTITEMGKAFYAYAVPFVQGIDNLFLNFMNHAHCKELTTINFAANHVSISYILPKYLKKFKDKYPDTRFTIRQLSRDEMINKVMNDEINFFIYPMPINEIPTELDFIPIVKHQPILLIRKDHPLANKAGLTLFDIAKYELVRIDPKFITLPAFEEIIKLYGFKVNIKLEVADWEILKQFVRAEIGVAMISSIILEGAKDDILTTRDLTEYFPEMTYGILFKKGKIFNGLTKDFISMLTTEKLLEAQK
ncbi:MAG: LysR family cys regulon transcriptional activator [Rickettsiales bacterium]|jgi:LysR family cys regulon transcriptional activator